MVEHEACFKSQLGFGSSKSDQAIAQLLHYSCSSKQKEQATTHRPSKDRESPFPVYMGMAVYAKIRKRILVEMLHDHGMSISYDRVLEISPELGDATVSIYVEEGVVCPPVLRIGLFTTAAMDNIDHNPSATTATTSFMYFFSVIKTNSFFHKKKYTGIFISGKDMNATSFAGAILDTIFDLTLRMLFYTNRRPLSNFVTFKVWF